eukprot:GSA120T00012152001.1
MVEMKRHSRGSRVFSDEDMTFSFTPPLRTAVGTLITFEEVPDERDLSGSAGRDLSVDSTASPDSTQKDDELSMQQRKQQQLQYLESQQESRETVVQKVGNLHLEKQLEAELQDRMQIFSDCMQLEMQLASVPNSKEVQGDENKPAGGKGKQDQEKDPSSTSSSPLS